MKNKSLALLLALMLLTNTYLLLIPLVKATEWHVFPGQLIQSAVDAANPGDTIIVHAGTYAGAIVDKNLTISGVTGEVAIITSGVPYKVGSTLYTAFRLDANADGAKIRNFKINCNSLTGFYFAIFGRNVDNAIIDSLTVNDAVQGITNWGGSNWKITNNVLNNTEAAGGGGIAIFLGAVPPSYPVCSGNFIQNNTVTASATAPDYTCPGIGVALDLRYGAYDKLTGSEDISNNQILNNNITAPGALNGIGVEMGVLGLGGNATKIAATLGIIHDNIIQDNNIDGADLGVYFYTATNLIIQQNEIKNCHEGIHIKDGISGNTIDYNNIFGNAMGINNTVAELIDARFNWWGDASGPAHSSNVDGVGDPVTDYVDYSPWLGDVFETTPRTYHVNPTGTIQEAIDAASPGDTITVHSGTYDEQVIINKSLTVQGMGDTTIVKPSSAAKLTTILDGHYWGGTKQIASIIVANVATGSSVALKNFKVDGESVTTKPTGADYVTGFFYRETGGTMDSVTVTGMTVGITGTSVRGYGIYLSAMTNTVSIEVKGSTITNYDKNGIDAHGNKLTVNIHDNILTGRGPLPSGDEVQNGIVIMDGVTGTINANTISNMAYEPKTWWSAGIMFLDSSGSAVGNIIAECQIGVIFQDGSGSAQGNTVTGGTVGLLGIWAQYTKSGTWTATFVGNTINQARDSLGYENGAIGAQSWNEGASITVTIDNNQLLGDGSTSADGIFIGDLPEYEPAGSITAIITDNVISGWQHGIRLVSSVTEATITGNTISNNVGADSGIHIEPAITVNNIHINYNNIFGNNATDTYGLFNNGIGALDARYNWWGNPTGPYHPQLNPSGKGDKISNYVDFEPWLLEPCPPATPVETLLYIDPAKVEFWTPSYNGIFKVEVKIVNVTDLTCYEFKLYWNTTLLDFYYAFIIEIWPLQIKIEDIDEHLGRYWLAVAARGEEKFTGNETLVEIYFKIKYDPIYPNNVYTLLNLNETVLGDASEPTPRPIAHMVHDGEYWCYSTKPKMKVEPLISTAKKLGQTFEINVTVQDIVNLYDFEFWLHYNTTLLDIYAPHVRLGPLMSGATIYIFEWNDILGSIHFAAKLTSPAPPVNGSGTIAIVTFKTTKASIWPEPDLECALSLDSTKLKTIGGIEVPHDKIGGLYRYKPVIGDLNSDGTVDLDDFYIIALAFGSKPEDPNWNKYADLTRDNVVNVLDLRTAARHFGEDC